MKLKAQIPQVVVSVEEIAKIIGFVVVVFFFFFFFLNYPVVEIN